MKEKKRREMKTTLATEENRPTKKERRPKHKEGEQKRRTMEKVNIRNKKKLITIKAIKNEWETNLKSDWFSSVKSIIYRASSNLIPCYLDKGFRGRTESIWLST